MGLFDSLKDRLSANLKLTRLSFMTQPHDIIAFCQGLTPVERASIMKGIESQFKWQSVAQVAQAMFPSYSYGGGVSAEALDMVKSGQVSGGAELMRMENQAATQQQWGMLPVQQASLSFAWTVLRGIEQRETVLDHHSLTEAVHGATASAARDAFCTSCGATPPPRTVLHQVRSAILKGRSHDSEQAKLSACYILGCRIGTAGRLRPLQRLSPDETFFMS